MILSSGDLFFYFSEFASTSVSIPSSSTTSFSPEGCVVNADSRLSVVLDLHWLSEIVTHRLLQGCAVKMWFLLRPLHHRPPLIFCYTSSISFAKKGKSLFEGLVSQKSTWSNERNVFTVFTVKTPHKGSKNLSPILMKNAQHIKSLITCYRGLNFCFAIQLFKQREHCKIWRTYTKKEKTTTSAHFCGEISVWRGLQMN